MVPRRIKQSPPSAASCGPLRRLKLNKGDRILKNKHFPVLQKFSFLTPFQPHARSGICAAPEPLRPRARLRRAHQGPSRSRPARNRRNVDIRPSSSKRHSANCRSTYSANCLSFTAKLQCHRAALQSRNKLLTSVFRFRRKDGEFAPFRAKAAAFRNPLTKKVK